MQLKYLVLENFNLLSQFHVTLLSHSAMPAVRLRWLVCPENPHPKAVDVDAMIFKVRHADSETNGQVLAVCHRDCSPVSQAKFKVDPRVPRVDHLRSVLLMS